MISYGLLAIFGVFVSASFLNIPFSKRNIRVLSLFSICTIILQIGSYSLLGFAKTEAIYPVIVHIPLLLFFVLYYKKRIISCISSILTAYLCCQISKWISILFETLFKEYWINSLTRIVFIFLTAYFVIHYVAPSLIVILSKSQKSILVFSILPTAYYVFDYGATVYTDLLYQGRQVVFEFLPFMLCIANFSFCVIYLKEYEEKCEAERLTQLMEIKRTQSMKEIEAIKRSEYAVSLLRHDMRHFLSNILAFIDKGDTHKTKEYIHALVAAVDDTTVQRYCNNEIVNLILSSYEKSINENEITLDLSIQIPDQLPISDIDLTSILSNGIENAIHAVSELAPERRMIDISIQEQDTKLLISIKNMIDHKVEMVDHMPTTSKLGHGLGTQSIRYITEKLGGNCQFLLKEDLFILQVVL